MHGLMRTADWLHAFASTMQLNALTQSAASSCPNLQPPGPPQAAGPCYPSITTWVHCEVLTLAPDLCRSSGRGCSWEAPAISCRTAGCDSATQRWCSWRTTKGMRPSNRS